MMCKLKPPSRQPPLLLPLLPIPWTHPSLSASDELPLKGNPSPAREPSHVAAHAKRLIVRCVGLPAAASAPYYALYLHLVHRDARHPSKANCTTMR